MSIYLLSKSPIVTSVDSWVVAVAPEDSPVNVSLVENVVVVLL